MSSLTLSQIYSKLNRADLVFLLGIRELPTNGSDEELVTRLTASELDLFPTAAAGIEATPEAGAATAQDAKYLPRGPPRPTLGRCAELPYEVWLHILRYTSDWELAAALANDDVGLQRPIVWEFAKPAHLVVLRNDLRAVRALAHADVFPLPSHVLEAVIRFEYIDMLQYVHEHRTDAFREEMIPLLASRFNSPRVLDWWRGHIARPTYDEGCLDAASASGRLDALEWWRRSGLPLRIGRVMDFASDEGHTGVLEWWKSSGLKYKYSKGAMHLASQNGHVHVLDWWLHSGLQLFYDNGCLDVATRFNRVAVLAWWKGCGLVIEYRIIDIEEALGEAVVGGNQCRNWWVEQGIDFGRVAHSEWMRDRPLNEHARYMTIDP